MCLYSHLEVLSLSRKRIVQNKRVYGCRVPIIKLSTCSPDPVPIDISVVSDDDCSNERTVQLMNALMEADARVRPFLQMVKLWAKRKQLADGMHHINSFGFGLLGLKFLQECEPTPILPVLQVQDGAVITIMPLREPSKNNSLSLGRLLHQYFKFWQTFDFASHSVSIVHHGTKFVGEYQLAFLCVCTGRMLKLEFPGFSQLKESQKFWIIQDPVNLEKNVAINIREDGAQEIVAEFTAALEAMKNMKPFYELMLPVTQNRKKRKLQEVGNERVLKRRRVTLAPPVPLRPRILPLN